MRLVQLLSLFAIGCGSSNPGTTSDGGTDGSSAVDAPPAGSSVTLTLVDHPTTPATFSFIAAFQDGDGAWAVAPAPSGDVYTLPITSDHYGVGWTCIGSGDLQREVNLAYFTVAERSSLTLTIPARCTDRGATGVKLSGAIANPPNSGTLTVAVGNRTATADNAGTYALEVPPGTYDVFVLHSAAAQAAGSTDLTVDKVLVHRGLAITAAMTQGFDFANAVAVQSFPVTTGTATPGAKTTVDTTIVAGGTTTALVTQTKAPFTTESLALSQIAATDVYIQQIAVATAGSTLRVQDATATPALLTYTAPATLGGALAAVPTATPYPEVKTTWTAYTDAVGYTWGQAQAQTAAQCATTGNAGCTVTWVADISAAYAGTATSFQMPDLSMLAGWSASFQLLAGTQVLGTIEAETSSAGPSDFPTDTPPVGTQRTFARAAWTVTP